MSDLKVTYEHLLNASAAMSDLKDAVSTALRTLAGQLQMSPGVCNATSALQGAFPDNEAGRKARTQFSTSAESMLGAAQVLQNSASVWSGAFTELVQVFEALDTELAKEA